MCVFCIALKNVWTLFSAKIVPCLVIFFFEGLWAITPQYLKRDYSSAWEVQLKNTRDIYVICIKSFVLKALKWNSNFWQNVCMYLWVWAGLQNLLSLIVGYLSYNSKRCCPTSSYIMDRCGKFAIPIYQAQTYHRRIQDEIWGASKNNTFW